MKAQRIDQGKPLGAEKWIMPNFTRPVWQDQEMTCEQCIYNDQDIDTCPCAKCHTRN